MPAPPAPPLSPTTRSRRMSRPGPRRAPALVAAVALGIVTLAACGATPPSAGPAGSEPGTTLAEATLATRPRPVQALEIEGTEYAFAVTTVGGGALAPGWTEVTFHNGGAEAHQVMFARLKDGVDLAELAEVAGGDSSGSKAIEFVDMLGGVSYVGPGRTVRAMVDLPEGTVLAMCYVPDAHGVAHALSGMTTMLTVGGPGAEGPAGTAGGAPAGTADPGPTGASAEPVQGTIVMGTDGYRFPSAMPAGWYHVVNENAGEAGAGLHELSILGLDEELDPRQFDKLLGDLATNAPPSVELTALGGMGALSAGLDGFLYLDLEPGHYLAVDFMPDPGDARPHLLDGYATPFQP